MAPPTPSKPLPDHSDASSISSLAGTVDAWFERGARLAGVSKAEVVCAFLDALTRNLSQAPPSMVEDRIQSTADSSQPKEATPEATVTRGSEDRRLFGGFPDNFEAVIGPLAKAALAEQLKESGVVTHADGEVLANSVAEKVLARSVQEWGPGVGSAFGPEMIRSHRILEVYHVMEQTGKAAGKGEAFSKDQWRALSLHIRRPAIIELAKSLGADADRMMDALRSGQVPSEQRPMYISMVGSLLEGAGIPREESAKWILLNSMPEG